MTDWCARERDVCCLSAGPRTHYRSARSVAPPFLRSRRRAEFGEHSMTMNRPFRRHVHLLTALAGVATAAVGLPAAGADASRPAASPAARDVSTQDVVVDHSFHDESAPLRSFHSAPAPKQNG